MKRIFSVKPHINKNNKQITITIPKKKINASSTVIPKKITLKILEWLN